MTRAEMQARIYELEIQRRALIKSFDTSQHILRNLERIAGRLRDLDILRRVEAGETQVAVARSFRLSQARVGAIYHRMLRRRAALQYKPAAVRAFHVRLAALLQNLENDHGA